MIAILYIHIWYLHGTPKYLDYVKCAKNIKWQILEKKKNLLLPEYIIILLWNICKKSMELCKYNNNNMELQNGHGAHLKKHGK